MLPSGLYTWPSMSWIMKRPTRVPASTAVRMNSASNRIAKWYQNASIALPPSACAEDLRHADGERRRAAGARQDAWSRRCPSPSASIISGVIVKPQLEMTCAALAAVVPMTAAGAFIAK